MITKEFAEATTEINKILSYLPTEYIEKIPIKLRKFLKEGFNGLLLLHNRFLPLDFR